MSIPARIISVEPDSAVVETDVSRIQVARLFLPEAQVGDWVLVNAGQMVCRVLPDEAEAIRELWREISDGSMNGNQLAEGAVYPL